MTRTAYIQTKFVGTFALMLIVESIDPLKLPNKVEVKDMKTIISDHKAKVLSLPEPLLQRAESLLSQKADTS